MTLPISNASQWPRRFCTCIGARSARSMVVNRSRHAKHSRRRRMTRPFSPRRESTTRSPELAQKGQRIISSKEDCRLFTTLGLGHHQRFVADLAVPTKERILLRLAFLQRDAAAEGQKCAHDVSCLKVGRCRRSGNGRFLRSAGTCPVVAHPLWLIPRFRAPAT
jgi:hypothetical protein